MTLRIKETKYINLLSVAVSDRYLPPTDNQITELKKDIEEKGQRVPILVHLITPNSYRLIAGATRLKAMNQLGEQKIYATICTADSEEEYLIAELDENVIRRDLTADQRSEMKTKMRELQKQVMAAVEPSKGGRGKKGGISQAARAAGIPRQTAQRRKGAQNPKSEQVCAESKSPKPDELIKVKKLEDFITCRVTELDAARLDDNKKISYKNKSLMIEILQISADKLLRLAQALREEINDNDQSDNIADNDQADDTKPQLH